ncbi:MAG: N-6 DNA methylase, partial [Bacteroidales bacterium]|nr:N-6 DNA methylase [Bacteroidales bacterium]
MDKKAAINIIENTFNTSFDESRFMLFAKNLLNDTEPKNNSYSGQYIWDDFKKHINTYKRIGKYIDPEGDALDVLIVEVKSVKKLEQARTSLRNFVIKHLNKFEKDYALVAFYSKEDGGADWRFSFIKLEHQAYLDQEKQKVKTRKEFTPAKRYSFLVGKYEHAYTAKKQLLPLLQNVNNNPTIKELEDAFSIEKVTDEFFAQYKDLYVKLYEHFEKDNRVKAELEKAGIDNTRFTKKLLGQIVFLYFLQKKGWLGVPKNEHWGKGDKRFIQNLFDKAQIEGKNYFKDYLQPLFYEALAKERNNDNSYYKRFDCRIPFLNGGLFEAEYDWQNANITIPEDLFRNTEKNKAGDIGTGVLDVFDRYNFTIKEDEPLDKEVAVDPEMLGKVFENMLEITERKSKGAFYTPREIVHYMCQESLIHYLDNALESKVKKADIETFIRKGHFALENDQRVADKGKETKDYKYQIPESIRQNADLIDRKLSEIKILDPAIGSGAFPVGLLHELVTAHLVIKPHLSDDYLSKKLDGSGFQFHESVNESLYVYRLKRHIIQESIYGVDIDASAIDIARLRLWLSLVVDEDDLDPIETLPNLDYKIVKGNSLIGMPENAMRDLHVEKELEELKQQFYDETNEAKKKKLRTQINTKIRELLDSAEQFAGYKIDFDFKLYFSKVWHQKGGFDVVIGNPPYVFTRDVNFGQQFKNIIDKNFFSHLSSGKKTKANQSGKINLFALFIMQGMFLTKKKGILSFIVPNNILRTTTYNLIRKYILDNYNLEYIADLGAGIFANVTASTVLFAISNKKGSKSFKILTDIDSLEYHN